MNSKQRRTILRKAERNEEASSNLKPGANLPQKEGSGRVLELDQSQKGPITYVGFRGIFRRTAAKVWAGIGVIVTIGGLGGLYTFWPRVSIEPNGSTNPHNPFAQLLYVHNESIYSIYQVQPHCGIDDVSGPFLARGFNLVQGGTLTAKLGPDQRITLTCPLADAHGLDYKTIEVDPAVWFDLPFGIHQCRHWNFKGVKSEDGSYIWTWNGGGSCPSRK